MGDSRINCCLVDNVRCRPGADITGAFSTAGLVFEERGGIFVGGRRESGTALDILPLWNGG
jgi:hypothetical protein